MVSYYLFVLSQFILLALKDRGLSRELFFIFSLIFWSELSFYQYRTYAFQYEGFLFKDKTIHHLGVESPDGHSPIWSFKDITNPYSKTDLRKVIEANTEILKTESKRKSFYTFINSKQEIDDYQKELLRLSSQKDMDEFFQQVCLSLIGGKKINEAALNAALVYHQPISKSCALIIERTWKNNVGKI